MTCARFHDPATGITAIVCMRGVRAKLCACGDLATVLCDGRVPGVGKRTRRCDRPVCDAHATPVDVDVDLCPECSAARVPSAAPAGTLVAYTDGSGTIASLPCGGGVVLFDGADLIAESAWHFGLGTNNFAELSAVGMALRITAHASTRHRPLVVRTDSMYAIGSLTREDTHDGACNASLIASVRGFLVGRDVRFEHVRGHAGVWGNERADVLANRGRLSPHLRSRRPS